MPSENLGDAYALRGGMNVALQHCFCQYGCLPSMTGLANTQSPGCRYGACVLQSRRPSSSAPSIGTGFWEASRHLRPRSHTSTIHGLIGPLIARSFSTRRRQPALHWWMRSAATRPAGTFRDLTDRVSRASLVRACPAESRLSCQIIACRRKEENTGAREFFRRGGVKREIEDGT